jgi:hypothetical protein
MRTFKRISVLAVAVFALSAIGAANASASAFTASSTGELSGKQLETQKFKTNGGTVECKKASISGTVEKLESTEQEETVDYAECAGFGFPVHITAHVRIRLTFFRIHFKIKFTFTITGGIFGECTITVGEQEVGSVTYTNNSGKVKVTPNPVAAIKYTSSGGICGSSGENGEYSGATEIEKVGGTLSVD